METLAKDAFEFRETRIVGAGCGVMGGLWEPDRMLTHNFLKTPYPHLPPPHTSPHLLERLKGPLPYNCTCCKKCPNYLPIQSFVSPNTNLTYHITTCAD